MVNMIDTYDDADIDIRRDLVAMLHRPYCPACQRRLTALIEHNSTRCPGCGREWTVKWDDDNRLVVVK